MSDLLANSQESEVISSSQPSIGPDSQAQSQQQDEQRNENVLYTSWQRWLDQRMNHGGASTNNIQNDDDDLCDDQRRNQECKNQNEYSFQCFIKVPTDPDLEEKFGGFDLKAHNVFPMNRNAQKDSERERCRYINQSDQKKKYDPQDYIKNRKYNLRDDSKDEHSQQTDNRNNFDEIQQLRQDQIMRQQKHDKYERFEKGQSIQQNTKPLKGYDKQRSYVGQFDESLPLHNYFQQNHPQYNQGYQHQQSNHHQRIQHQYQSQVYIHHQSSQYENQKFQYKFDENFMSEIQYKNQDQENNRRVQAPKLSSNPFYAKIQKENPSYRYQQEKFSQSNQQNSQIRSPQECRCGMPQNHHRVMNEVDVYKSYQHQGFAVSPYQYYQQPEQLQANQPNKYIGHKHSFERDSDNYYRPTKHKFQDKDSKRKTKPLNAESQDFNIIDWM